MSCRTRRAASVGCTVLGALLVAAAAAGCSPGVAGVEIATTTPALPTDPAATAPPLDADALAPLRAAAGLALCPAPGPAAATGADALPAITLPCLGDGPDVNLATLTGVPYVINVWASWCQPCRAEAPYLAEVYAAASAGSPAPVRFLGIDFLDAADAALTIAPELRMAYPSVFADDTSIRSALKFTAPPWTFFVDTDGRVVGHHPGAWTSASELRAAIARYLGVAL